MGVLPSEAPAERAKGLRKTFGRARNLVGHGKITPYTLRHFFVSKAIMSGVDLLTITKWIGHSSTRMIEQVYGHLSDGHRKEQMATIQIGTGDNPAFSGEILDLATGTEMSTELNSLSENIWGLPTMTCVAGIEKSLGGISTQERLEDIQKSVLFPILHWKLNVRDSVGEGIATQ